MSFDKKPTLGPRRSMGSTYPQNNPDTWISDQGASEPSRSGSTQAVYYATGEYRSQPQKPSYSALVRGDQFPSGRDTDRMIPPPQCTYPPANNAWERRARMSSFVVQVDIPPSTLPRTPNDYHLQALFRTPGPSPSFSTCTPPSSVLVTPNSNFAFPSTAISPLQSYSSSTGISPLVSRCSINEKWESPYLFSPTLRPPQASDHHPVAQSGQDYSLQLGLYQDSPERSSLLENLNEFSSLHQLSSEGDDLQSNLAFPPGSTSVDITTSGDLPGVSLGGSQVSEEIRYDNSQSYAFHSTPLEGAFVDPQDEGFSLPVYDIHNTTSPNFSALSGPAPLDWYKFPACPPSDMGYGSAIPRAQVLGNEINISLRPSVVGPGGPVSRPQGDIANCENPEGTVRKKGGTSMALRSAADRRRKRNRRYFCDYCGDSFTSRQNLQNHDNSHFQRNPYPCKVCQKVYRHSRSLNRHLNKVHQIMTDKRQKKEE